MLINITTSKASESKVTFHFSIYKKITLPYDNEVRILKWSPRGDIILAYLDNSHLLAISTNTWKVIWDKSIPYITSVDFSPDGAKIALGIGGYDAKSAMVNIINSNNGAFIWTHNFGIKSDRTTVKWSHDGTKLAVGTSYYFDWDWDFKGYLFVFDANTYNIILEKMARSRRGSEYLFASMVHR